MIFTYDPSCASDSRSQYPARTSYGSARQRTMDPHPIVHRPVPTTERANELLETFVGKEHLVDLGRA